MNGGGRRYALYFAPAPDTALHRFGSRWLGRDAITGQAEAQQAVEGIGPERLAEITRSARHYGFHATLKAPFRLAEGFDEADLIAAVDALTATRKVSPGPGLVLAEINGWRALVLDRPCQVIQALADEMVAGLDPLRAPLSDAEIARRLGNGHLTPREQALLQRWGYPYVFDAFQFHMTLSGPVPENEGRLLDRALAPLVQEFGRAPLLVDGVALFAQPDRDSPFTMARRFAFADVG